MKNIINNRRVRQLAGVIVAFIAALTITNISHADGVAGTLTGVSAGQGITVNGGTNEWAGIINLTDDSGTVIPVYCIDIHTGTTTGVHYNEGAWSAANVTNLAAVTDVLRHGYPNATANDLAIAAGQTGATSAQAAAATQAAIWHYSDGITLDTTNDPVIVAIYNMLVATAGTASEPAPALTISPATADGFVGGLIGPFTVHTNAATVNLSAAGAQIVNAAGDPITTAVNGDTFYVKTDTIGQVAINATATATLSSGRVFLTTDPNPKQKLITAASTQVSTTASATAAASEQPTTTTEAPAPTTIEPTTTTPETTDESTTTTDAGSDEPTTTAATTTTIVDSGVPVVPTTAAHNGDMIPHTGSNSSGIVTLAAILLAVGAAFTAIAASRRRQRI